jgi:hypothetical protein
MVASVTSWSATSSPLDERDEFGIRELIDGLVDTGETGGRRQQGGQHRFRKLGSLGLGKSEDFVGQGLHACGVHRALGSC